MVARHIRVYGMGSVDREYIGCHRTLVNRVSLSICITLATSRI